LCNHKKTESKGLKEQLEKMEVVIKEKKKELKDLEGWRKKLKKDAKSVDKSGKMPKTVDACDTKAKKLSEQIT